MKQEQDRIFGKGIRDLCEGARRWCAKLETLSSATGSAGLRAALSRAFAPVLGGAECEVDTRGLVLLLIQAIRQLIARLLDEDVLHCEALAELSSARGRRDAASQALYRQLVVLRQLGLADHNGPLFPPGRLPRQSEEVAAIAAAVRPRLDEPDLELPPGVRLLPCLGTDFDQAIAALAAAKAGIEEAQDGARKARDVRDTTIDEMSAQIAAARSLHRAHCDLWALDPGKEAPCATR